MREVLRHAAVIDFETMPIQRRPHYPPQPVGVAVKVGNAPSQYLAFAHPAGRNTHTWEEARRVLAEVWESGRPILCHNCRFDVDVAEVALQLGRLPWDRYHDTVPLLFLRDPRAETYGLKPAAEQILGKPPEERDAVLDWLVEHHTAADGKRLSLAKGSPNYAGAYTGLAPVEIVAPYACGDTDRTWEIAQVVGPEIEAAGMRQAYDLERRLMPHLLDMERAGLRVDLSRLEADTARYEAALAGLEGWLCNRLGAPGGINLDSGPEVAAALLAAGLATEEALGHTKSGKIARNKAALTRGVHDRQVLAALKYRAQLCTALRTFMRPWLATARESGGLIFTTWHSTRIDRGDGTAGARTGRLSSTPNFMNMPKAFAALFEHEQAGLPPAPVPLPPLPRVRSYVIPYQPGDVLIDRDYSQQEPRLLAHFEGAELQRMYERDPWLDFHEIVRAGLSRVLGFEVSRKVAKAVNLGLIYGQGEELLATNMGTSREVARVIRRAVHKLYPGLEIMQREMRLRGRDNEPIRTLAGRRYYCEQARLIESKIKSYSYKMVNCLIQGSAADCTKIALAIFCASKPARWRVLLLIHDEIVISAPRSEMHEAMAALRAAMESVKVDVPMLSEGKTSSTDLASFVDYDKRGKQCAQIDADGMTRLVA